MAVVPPSSRGSVSSDLDLDTLTLTPAVGQNALTITAPAGAAANGDSMIAASGDTTGNFFLTADGGLSANCDTSPAAGQHDLRLDGDQLFRLDTTTSFLMGIEGSLNGAVIGALHSDGTTQTWLVQAKYESATAKLGFYNAPAVAKPTGVAVTAAGIHAALVTLGLIAA